MEINAKYKIQKQKEKLKLANDKKKAKLLASRLKQKERKQRRQERSAHNRLVKKCRRENPTIAKMIAKVRDWRTCQRCGNKKDIHWSHIINEARDHRLACDPDNIKALCYHCHMNLRHKDPVLATTRFNSKFPWRYDRLLAKSIEYSKMWSIEHTRILQRNQDLKEEYKLVSGKDWE